MVGRRRQGRGGGDGKSRRGGFFGGRKPKFLTSSRKKYGRYKTSKKRHKSILRWLIAKTLFFGLFFGSVGLAIFLILATIYSIGLPDVKDIHDKKRNPIIRMNSADNGLVANFGDLKNSFVTYGNFPENLINAVIATEDRRFFSHYGVDPYAIPRAFIANIRNQHVVQGGSTITQQLAKILFLTPEKTLKRKIQELLLALRIESKLSKQEIFELYMNKAYFGSGNYGVIAASRNYFDKEVYELNLQEAALLAGLLKAPSRYSPFNNPELSAERTEQILINMLDSGFITKEDMIIAQYTDSIWKLNQQSLLNNRYFANWVRELLPYYIDDIDSDVTIQTTLNNQLQNLAEISVADNFIKYKEVLGKSEVALVAMKPDGQVVAMLGGKNFRDSEFNRALYAKRQPGSIFKYFVYLTAIANGSKSDDMIIDQPVRIGDWEPQNYNREYLGAITLREAFVRSVNSVSVQLTEEFGRENVIRTAHRLGIHSTIPNIPSIALGTTELNLLEITSAYAHIANRGYPVIPHAVTRINNKFGNVIYERSGSDRRQIIESLHLEEIDHLMYNVVEWGTGQAAKIDNIKVRGKTGTSQESRDAWFIGYTDDIVVGVWVGNDDNSPMNHITGGNIPAKIWHDFVNNAYESKLL
jgi:penicillin-binding protein 1A